MLPDGAFVWTNFPFGDPPEARPVPGPSRHIAYHIGHDAGVVLLAYTSSGPWRGAAVGTPPGIVEFDAAEAAKLNQKPFHIDLPHRGVVAVAPLAVRTRILQAAKALVAVSPASVEMRGVGSDTVSATRRRRPV